MPFLKNKEFENLGESKRIPQLDGLRGIAILLILIWHYVVCQVSYFPNLFCVQVIQALNFTWSGVDLFFVLSGFLIGGILLDHRKADNYFQVFYIRRICRIFPLYFLWMAIFCVLKYGFPAVVNKGNLHWLFNGACRLGLI